MANTGTPRDASPSTVPASESGVPEDATSIVDIEEEPAAFPPYPPYVVEPAPPSVADTVIAGHSIRRSQKSIVKPPVHAPPKPALPRGPKATDVKLNRRAFKAHERCLRRHRRVLTDHLERIAKPRRRTIIYLWRDFANTLPSDTIARLRTMLDADEPFKPDQAYDYFIALRKNKKKNVANAKINELKKDILSTYGDRRFMWARNATVTFARGIQHKLSKPGTYALADGMLRLSNIILDEICEYMHMRTPSRCSNNPKAKFMTEMADKVAVWVDEILAESDDRMLMMDFDEDDDLLGPGGDAKFEDAFLDMMGDGGDDSKKSSSSPAYLKFSGPMLEAFNILTESMYGKGDAKLLSHGKFDQTYTEGADELKQATDFQATEYNSQLANQLNIDLTNTSKSQTPSHIANCMKDMVDICSKYLSQVAEYNKEKGPAFRLLVDTMRNKRGEQLYQKDKIKQTYEGAAMELQKAKGLENDHDDPNLTQDIYSSLTRLMANVTPDNLKKDMEEAIDLSSKYLSQEAVDKLERGPAFDLLIKTLQENGADTFSDYPAVATNFAAACVLKSAPGLTGVTPDPNTAPMFASLLHKVVDSATTRDLKAAMPEVIDRCANYLSAFVRDRDIVLASLLEMMKSKPKNIFASRPNYSMNYHVAAADIESAPALLPYLPIKDVADDGKQNLTKDMADRTPDIHQIAMKALIQDAARYLSQPFALRSGIGGPRYAMEYLAAIKRSLGVRPLFKYKAYGQTYSDAANTLMYEGPQEIREDESTKNLHHQIKAEMKTGISKQIAPTIVQDLHSTVDDASKQLASVATEKGDTLEHLVGMMKEKANVPLAQLQGYEQTYNDGARRIENAPSLMNDKVDKTAYDQVKRKLNTLTTEKAELIPEKHVKHMPEIVEMSSKFLSAPVPETNAEKRQVLSDLMARKGTDLVGQEGLYKMTHIEGGEEIKKAPVGQTKAQDEAKNKEMLVKVRTVVPDNKMMAILKDPIEEGAAHLTDTIKGRGEAFKLIQDGLNKEQNKDLLTVGAFSKTHEGGATMLSDALNFNAPVHPAPVLVDVVDKRVTAALPTEKPLHIQKQHIDEAKNIASTYIAGVATKECGLDAKALEQLDAATFLSASEAAASGAAASGAQSQAAGQGITTDKDRRQSLAGSADEAERQRLARLQGGKLGGDKTAMSEAERLAQLKAEKERLARLEAERLRRDEEQRQKEAKAAMDILVSQLRAHGPEVFHEQSLASLTHQQAADWLTARPAEQDKSVKDSGDTTRLAKKFEKKLGTLTRAVTPAEIQDTMQDVIIESSQQLAEDFIVTNNKAHARESLISEMQKRGNEILIEVDGAAETTFFAAQRIKKEKNLKDTTPCTVIAPRLLKKLDTTMRHRSIPRKLTPSIKEYTKDVADYLSVHVTKPDPHIEAYVALLEEMETAGDKPLIEGVIPKTHKEAAAYLRQLTSFEDKINRPNNAVHNAINNKLHGLMANVTPAGYSANEMKGVITTNGQLLTSYVTLEAEKTQALNELIKNMDGAGNNALLRHGHVRKSFRNGADILRGKTTDQLAVSNVDPVVARKVEIKLNKLMEDNTPDVFKKVMNDVIQEATMYLAVHLLEPRLVNICKCMKSKYVQCEMWCEEILRRVARPSCTCSRHISMEDVEAVSSAEHLRVCPGTSRTLAPGLRLAVTTCRSRHEANATENAKCQALKPSTCCLGNATTSYMLDAILYNREQGDEAPTRIPAPSPFENTLNKALANNQSLNFYSECSPTAKSLIMEMYSQEDASKPKSGHLQKDVVLSTPATVSPVFSNDLHFHTLTEAQSNVEFPQTSKVDEKYYGFSLTSSPKDSSTNSPQSKSGYSSRVAVSTEKMADWHSMLVSLLWNVEAWRKWIQENIDRGLSYQLDSHTAPDSDSWVSFQRRISTEALKWRQYNIFSRKLTLRLISRYRDKDVTQNNPHATVQTLTDAAMGAATRQAWPKLASRGVQCRIISQGTIKNEKYHECAQGMLEIIEMFNRWTQWLILVVKETGLIEQSVGCKMPLHVTRWHNYKNNIEKYVQDWINYNLHLKLSWEKKFESFISECVPNISKPGPLWVMSACGAVPSGAVAAGIFEGEVIWVARTTHRSAVLPAALHPSKHCCFVYAGDGIYHYTKYQVMCNVEVNWLAWRGGSVSDRAIQAAEGVYVGRILHRRSHLIGVVQAPNYSCQVIIFGRPFAFNFYELLIQAEEQSK